MSSATPPIKKKWWRQPRYWLLGGFILAIVALSLSGVGEYLSLEYLKANQQNFADYYTSNPWLIMFLFGAGYTTLVALSFPGAAIMTLAAGALFGFWVGAAIVSIASTIGATLAMLLARYVLGEKIQRQYGDKLKKINTGIEKEGSFYLFALRLVPLFPFFLVNVVMGLTKLPVWKYTLVSWLGMLPGTAAYVYAGTELAGLEKLGDILSPGLLFSFSLLGLLPLVLKKVVDRWRQYRVLRRYKKPKQADYNLVIIGAGAAGLVSAYMGTALQAKTALIEKHRMGGDCLYTGCVPSKALIKTADVLATIKKFPQYGLRSASGEVDFAETMARVQQVIKDIEPHDSVERYSKLGVKCISGEATVVDPYRVAVNGDVLTTRKIIIATGAKPAVPPIEGLDQVDYLTSDTLWDIKVLPRRLVIMGGGPIGCELAQAFARLGSQVTLVEAKDRILSGEDTDVSGRLHAALSTDGVQILTNHSVTSVEAGKVHCGEVIVPFDRLLLAVGRTPTVAGVGLEKLPLQLTGHSLPVVDNDTLQTSIPTIYLAGDVAQEWQFTHTAAHQAVYAVLNALFGGIKKFSVSRKAIPHATFTSPEVARVGLSEQEAKAQNIDYEVTTYDVSDLDRAIADNNASGIVKVLTKPGKDKILGVTIVAEGAGNLLAEYTLAMQHGLGLNKVLGTIHVYPTMSEANKYAASTWKQAHKPAWALKYLGRFMNWQRG